MCSVVGIPWGKDNFTSVSIKGGAAVDYINVPNEGLNKRVRFCFFTPNQLIERLGGAGWVLFSG